MAAGKHTGLVCDAVDRSCSSRLTYEHPGRPWRPGLSEFGLE